MVVLTLKAKNDHLQKVASTRDPVKAISEFVWNALDAEAMRVSVDFQRNSLGGIVGITIDDNGRGISRARAEHDFESVGDSWKLNARRSPLLGRAIHGKEGKGRLRFFSLSQKAVWESVYEDEGGKKRLKIDIDSDSLQTSNVSTPTDIAPDTPTGTRVDLYPLKQTFDWLIRDVARAEFAAVFSPYIMQYTNCTLLYDNILVDPKSTIEREYSFETKPLICPGRTINDLSLKIIEWKVGDGNRKIYFGGEAGVVLGSQAANITAPGFNYSVYAYAQFFQEIADANLLELDGLNDPDFAKILEYIKEEVGDYFRSRQAEKSSELIQDLKNAGIYPYEGDPKDEVEKRERQVFDIATHAVSSYSKDFKRADNQLKKITLGLLREAVGHNPDSVSRILRAVFNLPKIRQDEFSGLLEKTELGNIIAASSLVANRVIALKILREMVFEPKHRHSTKERGELDTLVKDNTWIFGESFHITMPEAGLTKIMDRVSNDLQLRRSRKVKIRKADGKTGRVDNFLGRVVPHGNGEYREYILIELKRPSLTVGRIQLDQLEDYVNVIVSQPDYISTSTFWNFFLVTTDYDEVAKQRITQADRPAGLFLDKPNYRVWIKTWAELIREAESRIRFVQEKLQIDVSTEEIETRIAQLKASYLRSDQPTENDQD